MSDQNETGRMHAGGDVPARRGSGRQPLSSETPSAEVAHPAKMAHPADAVRRLERIERVAERLANPERSLFEEADTSLAGVHRGSPLSLATGAASGLGVSLGVSLVAIVRVVGGNAAEGMPGVIAIAAAIIALSVASSAITWRTRTWELTDTGIMLRSGIVTSKQLQVPYEHIHTVNMSSGLIERALGLMTLDLDTGAASSEGEMTRIKGLQAGMAEALREELFRRKAAVLTGCELGADVPCAEASAEADGDASPAASKQAPDACYTLTTAQLLLAALTEARIVAQAAAFLILIVQGVNLLQESALVNLSNMAEGIAVLPVALLIGAAAILIALALVVGFAVSFIVSLIGYAGYRVERAGGRISVERGLLSRTSHAIALERIQSLRIRQGLIRQFIGYAEVRASVVGNIGSSDETSAADGVVLHPFIRMQEIDAFLEDIAPEFSGVTEVSGLARLPRAAARRLAFRAAARSLLLGVALAGAGVFAGRVLLADESWSVARSALGLVLVAVWGTATARIAAGAVLRYRDSRIGHDRTRLMMIVGGVKRRIEVAPRSRLQHAVSSVTPFQRRLRLATFASRTAATGDLALRDISANDAEALLAWVRPRGSGAAAQAADPAAPEAR